MNINQLSKKLLLKDIDNLPFVNYEPAVLKEWPTGWQIEFRILNPDSGQLIKKRLRFEKIRKRQGSDSKARKFAKIYCSAINEKLESGWNPYIEGKKVKTFHKLLDAFKAFLNEKEIDMKNGVFRYDSMRSYCSHIDIFSKWLQREGLDGILVGGFTKEHANRYLDYIYLEKKLSSRTWNNYLSFTRSLWNWLIEKDYCSENPFLKIKPKAETEKKRIIITNEWTSKIIEYFRKTDPGMELVCGLIYNSFMRPLEICRTKISDIRLSQGGIYLPGTITKNGKARWCLLPPHLIEFIINMGIDKYPEDYYLISTGLKPGTKQLTTRKLDKIWHKMREAIYLPKNMQLYSLRDTGITDLKKAGHSNLFISSITGHLNSDEIETYTHAPDPKALQYIMEKSKQL
ncbi:MAG: tyrosine-type recombinase/integrase [Dysgonomonas sp.]|nr:tyrosine-type recombinase/integrase [Dysgonomonas sp.]